MKFTFFAIAAVIAFTGTGIAGADSRPEITPEEIRKELSGLPPHPRLFVGHGGAEALAENARRPEGKLLAQRIFHEAGKCLEYEPYRRRMVGHRMLDASRHVLFRINMLGMAYLLGGDEKYARRGVDEVMCAVKYEDWNPKHTLDTAEMTLAVAIGYDWFHGFITPEQQSIIRKAIVEKGLKEGLKFKKGWNIATNNWSQVCHAGMVAGAFAVAEYYPEIAAETIQRALIAMPRTMKTCYYPNGAYPEGPQYWSYGTEFNVVLLALLDSVLGKDFGLSEQQGFAETLLYTDAVMTPTGFPYTYADSWPNRDAFTSMARLWLMRRFNRPDFFTGWFKQNFERHANIRPRGSWIDYRLLPLAMFFLMDYSGNKEGVSQLSYYSGKEAMTPLGVHRSGSDGRAVYLAVKGGYAASPHGHMDGGSFLIEADGVRWACDLGLERYDKQEKAGVDLWRRSQDSGRWKVFRLGSLSHNILMIGGNPLLVYGDARITEFKGAGEGQYSMLDLTPLYGNVLKKAGRKAQLLPNREIIIADTLAGLVPGTRVRWQMCTQADVAEADGNALLLKSGGETMKLSVATPSGIIWNVIPDEKLRNAADTPNPNVKMVLFELTAPSGGRLDIEVRFTPGSVIR